METRNKMRIKRRRRIRAKISGTGLRPRLTIFRSHTRLYGQLIDDLKGKTLVSAWVVGKNQEAGEKLGEEIARKALNKKIKMIVLDRAGYRYHGVIAAISETIRKGGLQF